MTSFPTTPPPPEELMATTILQATEVQSSEAEASTALIAGNKDSESNPRGLLSSGALLLQRQPRNQCDGLRFFLYRTAPQTRDQVYQWVHFGICYHRGLPHPALSRDLDLLLPVQEQRQLRHLRTRRWRARRRCPDGE